MSFSTVSKTIKRGSIMAERRMFAKTIIDSDAFTEMPLSTQALYFHLSLRADDDGFLNCAQKIMRMIGAAKNDYDVLLAKRFVIQFNDGICVIKHWRIHNYIQSDRYKPTVYQEEKAALAVKSNGAYTLKGQELKELDTPCIQDGYTLEAQVRLGKDSIVKNSIEIADKPLSDFDIAINNFKDHRKKIKKPMTDHAVDLLKKDLQKYAPDDVQKQIELIDRAIMKGWQTVYPDKEQTSDKPKSRHFDYDESGNVIEVWR